MVNSVRKRKYLRLGLSALVISLTAGSLRAFGAVQPPPTAHHVDVKRFQGKWYEIARLPFSWENKCASNVTATYTLRPDGKINVLNICLKADGRLTRSQGTAKLDGSNSKLKVTFFWPFTGYYWILDLDPEYRWAVVGTPNRKYLWLLSRTPQLSQQTTDQILEKVRALGFDATRIIPTKQG